MKPTSFFELKKWYETFLKEGETSPISFCHAVQRVYEYGFISDKEADELDILRRIFVKWNIEPKLWVNSIFALVSKEDLSK